jgi:hypothetical protein
MSETPSSSSEPAPPANAPDGCGRLLLLLVGIVLLLPGLCSLGFLVGEIAQLLKDGSLALFRDGGAVSLWIMGIALSVLGIFMIRTARKARR